MIQALSTQDRASYSKIIQSARIPLKEYEKYSSWSNDSYTRNCLFENDDFELILLCWKAGQTTPIHDHGGEECWVKVIEGEFKEVIFKKNESGDLTVNKSSISKPKDITYMIDFMGYHSLENLSDKRSMSLHLYAKPIRNCKVFVEKTNSFINKELEYCTGPNF